MLSSCLFSLVHSIASNARNMLSRMHLLGTNPVWDGSIQLCIGGFILLAYTLATILYNVLRREMGLNFWILSLYSVLGRSVILLVLSSFAMRDWLIDLETKLKMSQSMSIHIS